MPKDDIPDDVLALLRERVSELDDLEVLLFVRSLGSAGCDHAAIGSELRLPVRAVQASIGHLTAAGLLRSDATERCSFVAETPAVEAAVAELAKLYAARPSLVMRVVNKLAIDRVRSGAARAFADAFVFGDRGRKKDG